MCNLGLGNYSDNNSVSVQFKSIFISIITFFKKLYGQQGLYNCIYVLFINNYLLIKKKLFK